MSRRRRDHHPERGRRTEQRESDQISDAGYQNITNGYSGLAPGAEVGNLIRVIAGTGRGQPPSQITANTEAQLTFQHR